MAWIVGWVDFKFHSAVQRDSARCASDYEMKYLARTDSPTFPTPQEIAAAVGITRGSPFPSNSNATCFDVEIGPGPTMTRPPFLAFYVTAKWATNAPNPSDDDDDPTTSRTVWSIAPQIENEFIIKDRNGDLVVNTAKFPFDGGISVNTRTVKATARRKIDATGYDKSTAITYSGKINETDFLGGAPGTVQVDYSASEHYEGAFHFWEETFEFNYNPRGWQPKQVSAGFFQIVDGDVQRITNEDVGDVNTATKKDPVMEPEPLDEDGALVPIADRPGGCVFVTVDHYEEIDMNTFGL